MDGMPPTPAETVGGHRISDLVVRTGVSKELIHHYLRQGLLPRPEAPASYSELQVRLLRVIRTLREEHGLPLEEIRRILEAFDFEPDHVEPLLIGEGVGRRLRAFADGAVTSTRRLTAAQLAAEAGVTTERVAEGVELGLLAPVEAGGDGEPDRFSPYDAEVVALCERGMELGVPFESFRTIASYVRVAFELEHAEFFDLAPAGGPEGAEELLRRVFVRREVAAAFVQSVFGALVDRYLGEALRRPSISLGRPSPLDAVIYRPSATFLRRHGVVARIEAAKARLVRRPDEAALWLEVADLLLHAAYCREAVFFLDQARDRFGLDHGPLATRLGIALSLSGETERGRVVLAEVVAGPDATPLARISLALALWAGWPAEDRARSRQAATVADLVDAALAEAGDRASPRARLFGGWLLTALPRALGRLETGRRLLLDTLGELASAPPGPAAGRLPGLRERLLLNAAYLAFECLRREPPAGGPGEGVPSLEELRDLICRLDPSSGFAEEAFLATS